MSIVFLSNFSHVYASGGAVPNLWATNEPNGGMNCSGLLIMAGEMGKWIDTGCLTNSKRNGRGFVCEYGELNKLIRM